MKKVLGYGGYTRKNNNGTTTHGSILKEVQITKLKNRSTSKGQCAYYGYCPNYHDEFPTANDFLKKDISKDKGGWVHIIKKEQKVRLPVLKWGEVVDL